MVLSRLQDNNKGGLDGSQMMPELKSSLAAALTGGVKKGKAAYQRTALGMALLYSKSRYLLHRTSEMNKDISSAFAK